MYLSPCLYLHLYLYIYLYIYLCIYLCIYRFADLYAYLHAHTIHYACYACTSWHRQGSVQSVAPPAGAAASPPNAQSSDEGSGAPARGAGNAATICKEFGAALSVSVANKDGGGGRPRMENPRCYVGS